MKPTRRWTGLVPDVAPVRTEAASGTFERIDALHRAPHVARGLIALFDAQRHVLAGI